MIPDGPLMKPESSPQVAARPTPLMDFDLASFDAAAAAIELPSLTPTSGAGATIAYQLLCCLWLLFFRDGLV